jgi:hypothetical protein
MSAISDATWAWTTQTLSTLDGVRRLANAEVKWARTLAEKLEARRYEAAARRAHGKVARMFSDLEVFGENFDSP